LLTGYASIPPQRPDPLLADDRRRLREQDVRYASDEMASCLGERMSVPPLDRIADVFVDHRALNAGVRSLSADDELLAILGDGDKRRQLTELGVDALTRGLSHRCSRAWQSSAESSSAGFSRFSSTIPSFGAGCASTSSSDRG
jgi:hypothetical protein